MMKFALVGFALLSMLSASAQAPSEGSRYVSMGSSYAAGPGVGDPDPEGELCARSLSNYAHLIAAKRHLHLVDVSCSGATTANILEHGQHGLPAQIEAVTPDTKFVSILIGGNDVEYVGNLLGLSCHDEGKTNCRIADIDEVERRMQALPGLLDRVVAEVRRRAPGTHIVLGGYLAAIPAAGAGACAAVPLQPTDAERMRAVTVRLAQAIGGAADRNRTGIVRSSIIGEGHDACSANPYVAGYHPQRNSQWPSAVAYHPNQAGMDAVAAALDRAISH